MTLEEGGKQIVPVSQSATLLNAFVHGSNMLLDLLSDLGPVRLSERLDAVVSSRDSSMNLRMMVQQIVKHFLIGAHRCVWSATAADTATWSHPSRPTDRRRLFVC